MFSLFVVILSREKATHGEGGGGGGGLGVGSVKDEKSAGDVANDDAMEIVLNMHREASSSTQTGTQTGTQNSTQTSTQIEQHVEHTQTMEGKEENGLQHCVARVVEMPKKEERKSCCLIITHDIIAGDDPVSTVQKLPGVTETYRNPRETMPVHCKIIDIEAPWTDTEELRRYMIENCITSKSWKRRQKCVNLLCNDDALVQKGSLGKILIDICSAIYLQVNIMGFVFYLFLL